MHIFPLINLFMANFSRNDIEKQVFNIVDLSTMSYLFKWSPQSVRACLFILYILNLRHYPLNSNIITVFYCKYISATFSG